MSVNSESPKHSAQPRVFMASLKSIAASSPAKTNWSPIPHAANAQSPARKAIARLLQPWRNDKQITHFESMISDSISDSKHLQNSIMVMTEDMNEHEVHCCKQDAATHVIHTLQKKAEWQIDQGNVQDALHNLNNSLSLQQKLYGKKHPKVAITLNRMGEVLANMGADYNFMAMSAFEDSLAIHQESEPGSEDTAVVLNNLYLLFHQMNEVSISSANKVETTTFQDFNAR